VLAEIVGLVEGQVVSDRLGPRAHAAPSGGGHEVDRLRGRLVDEVHGRAERLRDGQHLGDRGVLGQLGARLVVVPGGDPPLRRAFGLRLLDQVVRLAVRVDHAAQGTERLHDP
jgi:hypothetical protein